MHTLPVKTGTRPLAQVQKLIPGLLLSAALAARRSSWVVRNGCSTTASAR